MTISAVEFLRRFFLHILPKGFVRIRFCGFLAHRRRAHDLPLCRSALAARAVSGTRDADRRNDDAHGSMAVSALWRSDDRDRTTDGVPDLRSRHCGEASSLTPRDRRAHSTRSICQRSVAGTPEVSLRSHPHHVNVSIRPRA